MCDTPNRSVRNATLLQTGHWGMAAFDSNMGHVKHIKHWKPCLGGLMCYFGTNNRLLIHALCVILPTGHWGTPHYSQPTTEEWLHLTAISGTWNTLNIENHVWGAWCVISGQIIFSWNMYHVWYSQPAGQWGTPHYSQAATEEWMHLTHFGARERQQTLKTVLEA